jgi:hypothetical protein
LALEVISLLSRNKECVNEISACEIMGQFLRTLKDDDFQKQRVLETLSGLTNSPQLVKEAHAKGKRLLLLMAESDDLLIKFLPPQASSSTYWINSATPTPHRFVKHAPSCWQR